MILSLLENKLGAAKNSSGSNEHRFNCPFCLNKVGREDTDYHLYVNLQKGKFRCQRDETAGSIAYLLKTLNIKYDLSNVSYGEDRQKLSDVIFKDTTEEDKKEVVFYLPETMVILPNTPAYNYLLSRGLDQSDIDFYAMRLIVSPGGFLNRIIIPEFRNGRLVYWTGRAVAPNVKPTYLNVPGIPGADKIFNYDNIERTPIEDRVVVICEGPVSAMIAGRNAIATYSKNYTNPQVDLLAALQCKEYIVAYDGDATDYLLKMCHSLKERGVYNISFIPMQKGKDPANYGKEGFQYKVNRRLPFDLSNEIALRLSNKDKIS